MPNPSPPTMCSTCRLKQVNRQFPEPINSEGSCFECMEPAGHRQLVSIESHQAVVDSSVFFDPLAHKDFQDGGETFVGNRFFKKMSNVPESVFLHRWGSHPHLTQSPVQGEGPDGKKLRAVGIRSLSLHKRVVRNRPEALSENTVEKLQQFKQSFQEKY